MFQRVLQPLMFALLLLSGSGVRAQTEADWWFFGQNAGVHFISTGPVAVSGSSMVTQEGCASISDQNGNLLFYTDGSTVYNSNHATMTNGTGLMGNFSSTQSAIIVPFPGNSNKYYIFTVPVTQSVGLRYSVVDMTMSSGLGAVDNTLKNILVTQPVGEKVTSVAHGNGSDYWVMCVQSNSSTVKTFHVSSSGVNTTAVNSASPSAFGSGVGYLKASASGTKVAAGMYNGSPTGLVLWQFNNATGQLINPIQMQPSAFGLNSASIYGVEFSPNDSLCYAAMSNRIWQMNTSTWTLAAITASLYTVNTQYGWALQLGPDGKIYTPMYQQGWLSVINNPNVQGAGCGFVAQGVQLVSGTYARIGLPTFMQSFFNPDVDFEGICVNDSTYFYLDSADIDSVLWNFDDPSTGSENYSTLFNPVHLFSDTGTYEVTLIAWHDSIMDSTDYEVTILPRQTIDLGPDLAFCVGDTVALSADQPYATFEWSTGSTDSAILVTNDSIVMVTVFGTCDTVADTILIDFYYPFLLDLGPDTNKCTYDTYIIDTELGGTSGLSYQWSNGGSGPTKFLGVNDTGTYMVTVTDGYCDYADTIHIGMYPEVVVDLGNDSNFCYEPLVTLTPSTANVLTYAWNTGGTTSTLPITQTGVYELTVSGIGGYCHAVDSVKWSLWFEPLVDLGNDTSFCNDDILTLTPFAHSSFPIEYRWNDNSPQSYKDVNLIGLYWVEVSDENCATRDSIIVDMYPVLEATLGDDVFTCEGKTITLSPQTSLPVTNYLWSDGSSQPTLDVTAHGTYYLTVDNGLCDAVASANVFYFEYPRIDLGPDRAICPGDPITLTPTGHEEAYVYHWNSGQQTRSITTTPEGQTQYIVTVTNSTCSTIDTVTIRHRTLPHADLGQDTAICPGDSIQLGVLSNDTLTFKWSTNDESSMIGVGNSGVYTLDVYDGYCHNTGTIEIDIRAIPVPKEFFIDAPSLICMNESFHVDMRHPLVTQYRWQDGSTSPEYEIREEGLYWVTGSHICGEVSDTLKVDRCECNIWAPNTFHPNGDGKNDHFLPVFDCDLSFFEFYVFNRWGEQVFFSDDPTKGWDGTYLNEQAESDAYAWIATYRSANATSNAKIKVNGSVALIR